MRYGSETVSFKFVVTERSETEQKIINMMKTLGYDNYADFEYDISYDPFNIAHTLWEVDVDARWYPLND